MAQRIMSTAESDEDGLKVLSDVVLKDPAISIKVLGLANSALYGQKGQVSSLHRAVTIVGTRMLSRLALCSFVKAAFSSEQRHEHFWKHSVAVAFGASFLSKHNPNVSADDAFTAGLLHDVGILVLDTVFPEAYREIKYAISRLYSRQQAEQEILGVDHNQAAVWFAERWQLPEILIQGISGHHSDNEDSMARMIRVAEQAAISLDLGLSGEIGEEPVEHQSEVEAYLRSKTAEVYAFFGVTSKAVVPGISDEDKLVLKGFSLS